MLGNADWDLARFLKVQSVSSRFIEFPISKETVSLFRWLAGSQDAFLRSSVSTVFTRKLSLFIESHPTLLVEKWWEVPGML